MESVYQNLIIKDLKHHNKFLKKNKERERERIFDLYPQNCLKILMGISWYRANLAGVRL